MEAARAASHDDLPQIDYVATSSSDFIGDSRGAHVFQRREVAAPASELAAMAIEDDQAVAVVGTYDDVVFGYGIAQIESLGDNKLGRILHLAVEPEIRKSGIGEAMMNLLIAELKGLGCSRVDAYALPGDRHTKNFFESFGLKARLLTVHKEI